MESFQIALVPVALAVALAPFVPAQAGVELDHESGLHVGTWASNLSGWGTFGGANMELDLIADYAAALVPNTRFDTGLTGSMYPGRAAPAQFQQGAGRQGEASPERAW
ncbi:TorF family putative porin [Novosphingobium organovorum]|uniref:TorF family putative porin n=1 Tax=Novosphingobium organovorum TaxID=2930092 RepID=UPI0038995C98